MITHIFIKFGVVTELRITPGVTRLDNVVFNPDAVIEAPRRRKGDKTTECCGGAAMAALNADVNSRKSKNTCANEAKVILLYC